MHPDAIPLALWLGPRELARVSDWPWQFSAKDPVIECPLDPCPGLAAPTELARQVAVYAAMSDHVLLAYRQKHENKLKLVKCY